MIKSKKISGTNEQSFSDFNAWITFATTQSAGKSLTYVLSGVFALSADATIPANITLDMSQGGMIDRGGFNLTVDGCIYSMGNVEPVYGIGITINDHKIIKIKSSVNETGFLPKEFFGVTYIHSSPYNYGSYGQIPFTPAGFGSARLWDAQTMWLNLEPTKGAFYWTNLDWLVDWYIANGITDILLTLGQPPLWATGGVRAGPTGDNSLPPTDIQDWIDYVTAVVTRYQGKITSYEIWNEVNIEFYAGTSAQLYELSHTAYQIIKVIDPDAIVVSPDYAINYTYDSLMNEFLSLCVQKCFDVFAIHLYCNYPEDIFVIVQNVRSILSSNGFINIPIWNTEQTWGGSVNMTDEKSAAYAMRMYLTEWVAGIDKVFFYAFDGVYSTVSLMNLTTKVLTPAGQAFARFVEIITNKKIVDFKKNSDQTYSLTLADSNNNFFYYIWSDDFISLNVPVFAEFGIDLAVSWDGSKSYAPTSTIPVNYVPKLITGDNKTINPKSLYTTGDAIPMTRFVGITGSATDLPFCISGHPLTGWRPIFNGSTLYGMSFQVEGTVAFVITTSSFRLSSGSAIVDSSTGNSFVKFVSGNSVASSATNQLQIKNASATNAPELGVFGTATNIDVNITPKGTGNLNLVNGQLVVPTSKTPSSATDTGIVGMTCWDSNYIYVCVATDTWKRTAISTW